MSRTEGQGGRLFQARGGMLAGGEVMGGRLSTRAVRTRERLKKRKTGKEMLVVTCVEGDR